jgi:hypothetical protein
MTQGQALVLKDENVRPIIGNRRPTTTKADGGRRKISAEGIRIYEALLQSLQGENSFLDENTIELSKHVFIIGIISGEVRFPRGVLMISTEAHQNEARALLREYVTKELHISRGELDWQVAQYRKGIRAKTGVTDVKGAVKMAIEARPAKS